METNEKITLDELPEAEEAQSSSNIGSNEIDAETAKKLRGDAIGDTMYSEVFVLNTLIQFSDLKWTHEVEENLCFLWDMTEEKDVCQYLFQSSYPSLACSAITNYNEPRFVEIVVGIFANLLCSKCEKNIKEDEIKIVLDLLNSNDPYILIQVMRFIHAVSFMFDKLPFITGEHLDRINFVLYSSVNKELLVLALKTLAYITDDTKLNEGILKGELLASAMTAYCVIKEDIDCETEIEIFESQDQHVVVKHLIQFLCNVCCYIDNLKVIRLINELNESVNVFIKEMTVLMGFYSVFKDSLLVDEEFKFYIEGLTYIFRILAVPYNATIFIPLSQIMLTLIARGDNLQVVNELFCYFISVGNVDCLKEDLKKLSFSETKNMLSIIESNATNFEFYYLDSLREVLSSM